MKILLVSSSSGSRGGGELFLPYLASALTTRGHEVALWASSHPRMDELCASFSNIGKTIRANYTNTYDRLGRSIASAFDLQTARRVSDDWRRGGFDFIHLNKQNLEDGLDLLHALRLAGIPSLCTIHLTQSARYLRARFAAPRDLVSRRALNAYSGMLISVLAQRRDDLAAFLGDSPRLRTIANGVPLFDLSQRAAVRVAKRAELGIDATALVVIGVGRMVPQKRPLLFLEHAKRLLTAYPSARILWIGDGALAESWDREVNASRLSGTITRLAWQADVPSLLLAADVFLHTADFEGLPLAILEAMSAALPCAITENLLAEMPFLNSSNSISVSADARWLAEITDRKTLAERGAAARALAQDEYSFEKMAASYEALYREASDAASR